MLIIGGGQAAAQLAMSLRQAKHDGAITILGDEPLLPYQRPPLSKKLLMGEMRPDQCLIKSEAFYEKAKVATRLGVRAKAIDRAAKEVVTEDGERIAYDKLALCTGTRARTLPLPGADLPEVLTVRDMADAEKLGALAEKGSKAVIIGAGYVGLETAASLTKLGFSCVVLEAQQRILERVAPPQVSQFYMDLHAAKGVEIRTGAGVEAIEGEAAVTGVRLKGGDVLPADLVVIGVGALPNAELAEAAGLAVDNGIVVDEFAQTEDPDILAAGDCTRHPDLSYGGMVRLESVQNAIDQAKIAASTIMGLGKRHDATPWFWSDQYDVKLQIAGLTQKGATHLVRGDPSSGSFSCLHLDGDVLLAVDAIDRAGDFVQAKRLVGRKTRLDLEAAADPEKKLADCVLG